ncbi:forkhead-associated (FHA) domain-containing protein [Actinidia rufa]|uniref:Forkhead-associated (FHA) domain-containing protein n=1 Tax=Actinidia rufa TaxID=165716 RepID=A0A7J0F5M2_9ERIC|nr:forkhead-associated (FHA) domain-containing protein [Actinidia rufa]
MEAVALSSIWKAEDDLLLKNSIEAGASLEALAKGSAQFSRRFAFQVLQDRWHTLLYDLDISAQASARISTDLGFLAESNLHNYSGNGGDFHDHAALDDGAPVGNCEPNHFRLQKQILISCVMPSPRQWQGSLQNDGTKSFPQCSVHEDIPQNLEDNLADQGKAQVVEEMGSSKPLPETNLCETDGSDMKCFAPYNGIFTSDAYYASVKDNGGAGSIDIHEEKLICI